jgi:hypothetical protein
MAGMWVRGIETMPSVLFSDLHSLSSYFAASLGCGIAALRPLRFDFNAEDAGVILGRGADRLCGIVAFLLRKLCARRFPSRKSCASSVPSYCVLGRFA